MSKADTIHKADLRLTDISNMLGTDWVSLAHELEISDSDINIIKSQYPDNAPQQGIVMLRLWMQTSGNKANGNTLEKGLRKINRDDIVNQCIFNVELVTDDIERAMAKAHLDQSGFEAFKEELGPSRDTTLNRDVSLDVSYDEQDMMKEAESAEEEEENQRSYQDKSSREQQRTADMSPTYESEEKKYAGEEKVVTEEKLIREEIKDGPTITISTTSTSDVKEPTKDVPSKVIEETITKETKVEPAIKDQHAPEEIRVEPSQLIQETITMAEEVISKPEKMKPFPDEFEKKVIEKEEEEVVVKPVEQKKPAEDKIEVEKPVEKELEQVEKPDIPKAQTTEKTVTEVVSGPDGTLVTVTSTEKTTVTTLEDGTVQEHITVQKQASKAVEGLETPEDKSTLLQKLGEELGRLDEQLEEKFKEKRKADEPKVLAQEEVREEAVVAESHEGQAKPTSQVVVDHSPVPDSSTSSVVSASTNGTTTTTTTTTTIISSDISPTPDGFTQTSVESSQMSSLRGTAEVSFPGTTEEPMLQMAQALTQQAEEPPSEDSRVAHQEPLQREVYQGQIHEESSTTTTEASTKSGQTEERGCSPITVFEGRPEVDLEGRPEVDQVTIKPLARGCSHTFTTTTSWGAPLSTTTNIKLGDNESTHCLEFTLQSESRVTLHAPGEVLQELQQLKQYQEQQQQQQQQRLDTDHVSLEKAVLQEEEHIKADAVKLALMTALKQQKDEQDAVLKSIVMASSKNTCEKVEKLIASDSVVSDREGIEKTDTEVKESSDVKNIVCSDAVDDVRSEIKDLAERSVSIINDTISNTTNTDMFDNVQRQVSEEKCSASEGNTLLGPQTTDDRTLSTIENEKTSGVSPEEESKVDIDMDSSELPENRAKITASAKISEQQLTQFSVKESRYPAALSESIGAVINEVTAPSAHRPTTLMITSNSNESNDEAECLTNDPAKSGREFKIPRDQNQGSSMAVKEESEQQGVEVSRSVVSSEHLPSHESGAVPRSERPIRAAPRTTTLVKVKVEKRPVGSHSQVRDRGAHEHQTVVVRAPSVEEEVRGLMQEVKEATSQIKREVKELRQADTPTPDTPTPLREFKEFLNREEEQEQERLPTIKETHRETEDDAAVTVGGGTHETSQLVDQQPPPPAVSHEQASSGQPTSGIKAGSAHGKSNLNEADLAVLESMVVAQEAEVEEMTFTQAQAELEAQARDKIESDYETIDKTDTHLVCTPGTKGEIIIPIPVNNQNYLLSTTIEITNETSKARDTGQQPLGDLTKRVADVASSMASTLESITAVAEGLEGSHLSSDEGEEQLMLMRDSPRWEDEEIQAEDTDEPRAIKAEIKLLVKTTELGKESIEIRSIREFVEGDDKNQAGFGGAGAPTFLEPNELSSTGDRVYTLQRSSPDVRSPSPRFVRPHRSSAGSTLSEPTQDEFDLMAQVRDVMQPDSGAGAQQAPGSSEGHK